MPKSSKKENPKKDNSENNKSKSKRVVIAETIEEIKKEKKENIETKPINSKIEVIINKNNSYEIIVEGITDDDKDNLKMNEWGSGTYNVEPAPIFGVIKRANQILSVFKVKK